ncbi:uncharacterized protein LOC133832701 [Humulus lupulus]|uniref:uncharacterized protein LOC133832701 n=1 Tax=Humulus lupulus TaxID=3486 RepID=UPI002B4168A4|nr:uncharacterized protein LOC133832701 [Humulus lupulus]
MLNKVGIGALLENKLKMDKTKDMMSKVFEDWDYYNSPVVEGKILILWRKTFVKVQVLVEHKQFLHCLVSFTGLQLEFVVSFVYGFNIVVERLGGKRVNANEIMDSTAWLAFSQLAPIKSIGSKFTWSNRQEGADRVYSKIDHGFINEEWTDFIPNTVAEIQWDVLSDHCFILIKALKMGHLGIKPFRFFNCWITHSRFKETVIDNWCKPLTAKGLLGVTRKLLRLKHALKAFSRKEIGDIEQGYHQAKGAYQVALTEAQERPMDASAQETERLAAICYKEHYTRYRSYLIQRSKVTWIQKVDENNSYFHACIKKRKEENRIISYLNDHGEVITDYGAVVKHFLDHFRQYMGSQSSGSGLINTECIDLGPCLDIDLQLNLIRKFTKADVKKALFSIPRTKSPGLDGYNSDFYKAMWKAVDYRPIACCNTLYKCISKMLCSRLSEVLPSIISPNQGTSYTVLMNGRLQGGFQGVKGLRQGDPISPLLFVLVMEYLTRLLQFGAMHHDFRFHPLCKNLKIINLCFVDDLVIFCKANRAFGGLGFGEGSKWNTALLGKYIWAISHQQEALWVKWVHAVYLKGQNFWQYQLKADASWYWCKICHLREMFSQEEIEKAGNTGRFKLRQLYSGLFQLIPVNYNQFVWNRVSVPKHRFITWLAVNSKLLTRDHLQRVMQLESSLCPVCDQELENHSHLLFGCYFSQQVVQKIHDWFGCSWPLIYSDWCRWIGGMSKGIRASKVAAVLSAIVYYVWHNRNICVVHNYSLSIMAVVELIKNAIKCRLSAFFSDVGVKL